MTLYLNLAELLGARIEQGLYRPGDRLPSVRSLSQEHGVSLSTVQQAYRHLEDQGLATLPSDNLSPTLTFSSLTTPDALDGTSIVALSDSSVTRPWSCFTVSPTATSTSITGTSS